MTNTDLAAQTHARLTPQMRSVVDRLARAGRPALHTLSPAQARIAYEAGAGVLEVPRAELPRVEDLHVPSRDGVQLPARLYAPGTAAALPALLYLHGGGFTIGSVATHDVLCRELARLGRCMVLSLDYRLAPEHAFPTASNDAWDALAWLAANAARLGADPGRLAVGGVADVCIFDPAARWTVQADTLRSQGKHTPFSGYELPGRVRTTIVGGQVAYDASV